MKREAFQLFLIASILISLPNVQSQTSHPRHFRRHWTETETETLWSIRYTNCDYGYFVLLGGWAVAHGTHSPNPNHGFVIPLPDIERKSPTTNDEDRFVWVDATYNTSEEDPSAGPNLEEAQDIDQTKNTSRIVEKKRVMLAGLPATFTRVERVTPQGTVIEEGVRALRSGIIYTISLETLQADFVNDDGEFRKIWDGFRLLRLPHGECSNG
jgi:hypothetical protein